MRPGTTPAMVLALMLCLVGVDAVARGVYQTPDDFVGEVFGGDAPRPSRLWISKEMRPGIRSILGHDLGALRLRYWGRDGRTVWILDVIGKEKPITAGIVVDQGRIERVKVLAFRESRGSEVRYGFFADQFAGLELDADNRLSAPVDNISGATLSVRAVKKMARLALYLHRHSGFAHDAQ